ncbi:uncharacterized protein IL334_003695 [Kwoniella shivajii]|uniref:Uncharacterized protein n=1 Tax=Kwoniella shivajii TaxID=564305 RepID=A0ABZ1D2C0_9TREE|nr:hypothetical protein IL334_003695 [Kwoniella shivajii]
MSDSDQQTASPASDSTPSTPGRSVIKGTRVIDHSLSTQGLCRTKTEQSDISTLIVTPLTKSPQLPIKILPIDNGLANIQDLEEGGEAEGKYMQLDRKDVHQLKYPNEGSSLSPRDSRFESEAEHTFNTSPAHSPSTRYNSLPSTSFAKGEFIHHGCKQKVTDESEDDGDSSSESSDWRDIMPPSAWTAKLEMKEYWQQYDERAQQIRDGRRRRRKFTTSSRNFGDDKVSSWLSHTRPVTHLSTKADCHFDVDPSIPKAVIEILSPQIWVIKPTIDETSILAIRPRSDSHQGAKEHLRETIGDSIMYD